ncbi:porin [Dyella flagellata]|uniref:Membrane protein n=1 Tax=Dyella flagellata TaxID=1867833 RepID=A0ABQ5X864_9GAMM|nr:porin [Dyella flagellata]GLQ87331.1 membrane protein [Dyella flagellata]
MLTATETATAEDELTWHGMTLYGVYDIGVAYLRAGAKVSSSSAAGLNYFINKTAHESLVSIAPNGLSQSSIGLRGKEKIAGDFDFIFKLETGFSPHSFRLTDGLQSYVYNNGVPQNRQHAAGDSSRAGQAFNGPAYFGFSSATYGSLTLGRNNLPDRDAMSQYDPLSGSYAFSILSYSNAAAGIGVTEDGRLNNSVKYAYRYKHVRVSGLFQPGFTQGSPGIAKEIDVGFDQGRWSMDVAWGRKNTAISASPLTAEQMAKGAAPDSLAATISDNSSYLAMTRYKLDHWTLYAGFVDLRYRNPSHPLAVPLQGLGGHWFSVVNNSAYPHTKVMKVYWIGFDHPITAKLDLAAGWYYYSQNAYGVTKCGGAESPQCSGSQTMPAARLDYRINRHFDTYAGAMYSRVSGGMASGYLHRWNVDPMIGVRFRF